MKQLMLGVLVFCVCVVCRAQVPRDSVYEATVQRGIQEVYNLEFEKAERDFAALVELRPQHPAGHFFRAMITWWRIMIDMDNRQYDAQFFGELDVVVHLCDSLLEVNPNDIDAIFFKGGAIGFEGRLQFHRDDWLAAANAGRKALPLVQQASELDPHNYDILLGTGIYNYYAEVIPTEYPFVKPLLLFIPSGDKKKGIEQLRMAALRARYASIETSYFLMQIYYSYERDYPKAIEIARSLCERFPNNMMFHKYLGRCHVVMGNWAAAEETFREIGDRVQRNFRGYTSAVEREAIYYLGLCAMNSRRFDSALQEWYRCDALSRQLDVREPSGFMVMANLKIGMIYDLQGRRELAVRQYEKVLAMKEYKDSVVQAERYLKTPYTE
jgi:tetratricopeptide (TPR) repeat protein